MTRHVFQALLTCTLVLTWHVLCSPVQAATSKEWITQPGFRVAVDTTGGDYPVSIAFVPRLSDHPTAPLYYVAELHGRIKVVTRQRTVQRLNRYDRGKPEVRRVAARLMPHAIAYAPKIASVLPICDWFRGSLLELLRSHRTTDRLKQDGIFDT